MVERGTLTADVAGSNPASPANLVIDQVEIIEPKWAPLEVAMWEAGLVPVRRISREEALQKWPVQMTDLVERVARALCRRHYENRLGVSNQHHIDINVDANWGTWSGEAETAIAAMREPTEAMVKFGDSGAR